MIIFIYLDILLRFLINTYSIVFIGGKRNHADISNDSDDVDDDRTPTNEKVSDDGGATPNESLNDITDMKHTLEQVKRAARGEHIDNQELKKIKEEYSSYFDEDSGNATEKEAYEEIEEYLEGELSVSLGKASLAGLNEALDEISQKTTQKSSEESSVEPTNKKVKTSEASTSADSVSQDNQGLSSNTDSVSKGNNSSNTPGDYIDQLPSSPS